MNPEEFLAYAEPVENITVPKPPKRINTSAAKAITPNNPKTIYLILNLLVFLFFISDPSTSNLLTLAKLFNTTAEELLREVQ